MLMHMTLIKFPPESQYGQYRSFQADSDHVKVNIKATINGLDCTIGLFKYLRPTIPLTVRS